MFVFRVCASDKFINNFDYLVLVTSERSLTDKQLLFRYFQQQISILQMPVWKFIRTMFFEFNSDTGQKCKI